jgi:signal transduction histidine kinase
LLTIARVDAMGMQFDLVEADVAVLLRDRLAELSGIARTHGIALSLDCPEIMHAMVNPAGFASMVDNLVDNAIRYTPSGGCVSVMLKAEGNEIAFVVRDNGPGIASVERDRVFERFYRIPGSTSQGSGLGLAIVQRIARAHNASVRFVEGIAGSGLGVMVRLAQLPVAEAQR